MLSRMTRTTSQGPRRGLVIGCGGTVGGAWTVGDAFQRRAGRARLGPSRSVRGDRRHLLWLHHRRHARLRVRRRRSGRGPTRRRRRPERAPTTRSSPGRRALLPRPADRAAAVAAIAAGRVSRERVAAAAPCCSPYPGWPRPGQQRGRASSPTTWLRSPCSQNGWLEPHHADCRGRLLQQQPPGGRFGDPGDAASHARPGLLRASWAVPGNGIPRVRVGQQLLLSTEKINGVVSPMSADCT